MKILIVSWYFPPVNTIGALRVGKFARFLIEHGHDVGVVTGKHWGHPETLPLGVPLDRVAYANWLDINAMPPRMGRPAQPASRQAAEAAPPASSDGGGTAPSRLKSIKGRLRTAYYDLTNVPDNRIGWLPWASAAGRDLCRSWKPDLIFGSGPPFTALLACRTLSARLNIPWVAELRDRWADDPYDVVPWWRAALNQWLERRTLGAAAGLVTVTEPWAEFYRRKYDKPIATIYNGYDPLDFPDTDPVAPAAGGDIVIGYTGGIYPGRRDPTPLFEALRLLGDDGKRFRVVFCGTDPALVLPLAEHAGVRALVEVKGSVPYQQSIDFQRRSDVLLLMQWNDPREQGNCPGKFFEYIASLRPMLILGLENGVPATIARERAAGVCVNDPPGIAARLRAWLREKNELGFVRGLAPAARDGLSRTIQFEALEKFLLEIGRRT